MKQRTSAIAALAVAALAAALASCAAERERLDVPRLKLTVEQDVVERGGDVPVRVTAVDGSGLTYLRVWALAGDSIMSRFPIGDGAGTLYGDDSVTYGVRLRVTCAAPDGSPVEIQARTMDNQGFEVIRYDTVTARGGTCTQSATQSATQSR
ncbi:MAG TPA: hypothetical protein VKA84_29200 [Gemmatimonadaceae bacterium]|nr:hypothetical protein [Gemmatimonadaceae bacterium]